MSVVVGVDVVVKLLVLLVLLVAELAVEVGSEVLQSLGDRLLLIHIILQNEEKLQVTREQFERFFEGKKSSANTN